MAAIYVDLESTGGLILKSNDQGDSSGNHADVVQEQELRVIRLNVGTEFRQHGGSQDFVPYAFFPQ